MILNFKGLILTYNLTFFDEIISLDLFDLYLIFSFSWTKIRLIKHKRRKLDFSV